MRIVIFAATVLAIIGFFSCGGGGGGGGGDNETATATVGPEGGQLVSSNGVLTLNIPAGAVAENVELSIEEKALEEIDPALATLGPSIYYDLQPDGQVFTSPLTIAINVPVDSAVTSEGVQVAFPFMATLKDGAPEALTNQSLTVTANATGSTTSMTGELTHFSPLIVSLESNRTGTPESDGFYISVASPDQLSNGQATDTGVTAGRSATDYVDSLNCSASVVSGPGAISGELAAASEKSFDEANTSTYSGSLTCSEVGGTVVVAHQCQYYRFELRDENGANRLINSFDGSLTVQRDIVCNEFTIQNDDDDTIIVNDDDDGDDLGVLLEGNFATGAAPEGSFVLTREIFGNHPNEAGSGRGGIVVCGSSGSTIHDPTTGEIALPSGDGSGCTSGVPGPNGAFTIGSTGGFDQFYDIETGEWLGGSINNINQNLTDITMTFDGQGALTGALVANFTLGEIEKYPVEEGHSYGNTSETIVTFAQLSSAGLTTSIVSMFSPFGDGAFLAVTESSGSTPGRLVHIVPGTTPTITDVGDVGLGPRRIRCLSDGSICAVSNYQSGNVQIVDWPTRASAPTIRGTAVNVDGPVGIDIAKVGDKTKVVATGFSDNTFHFIDVTASDATDSSETLTNCTSPGHASFMQGGNYISITCNGNARLIVKKTPGT